MDPPKLKPTLQNINEDVFHEISKAILDTAWQNEHGKLLYGHQSIKCLSSTNRNMRHRLEPMVFRCISIDIHSWHITLEALKLVRKWQAARDYMTRFNLRIYDYARGSFECVDGIPEVYASILSLSKRIEKLSISVPEYEVRAYQVALHNAEVYLPSVRTLILDPQMAWMLDFCPAVTTIRTCVDWPMRRVRPSQHSFDFIQAVSCAKNLRNFEMEENWNAALVDAVHLAMPNLESLAILGWTQFFHLRDLVSPLGRFPNLKTLSLPIASELGIGFYPPDCGNAYMGPNGDEVRRQVDEEEGQAEQKALLMVCEACSKLEVVWIGTHRMARPALDKTDQAFKINPLVEENMLTRTLSA